MTFFYVFILTFCFYSKPTTDSCLSWQFFGCFFLLFIIFFSLKKKKEKLQIFPLLNALLFALFIVIGKWMDATGTITSLFSSFTNSLFTLVSFFSFTLFFYFVNCQLYDFLNREKTTLNKKKNKIISFLFYDKPFLCTSIAAISVSLFYLIFFYPGTVSFDGDWQLNMFFHYWNFSDHHPAFLTLFMGNLFQLGRFLLNDNLGIFFYIIIQVVLNGLVYGYCLKIMNKLDSPLILRVITFLYFTCFPFWVINSITYIKDTIYYLVFLLLFVYQYYHFHLLKDNRPKTFLFLALLYFVLYLWRNTGFYLALVQILFFLILNRKNGKKIIFSFGIVGISVLLLNTFYRKVFLVKFHIPEALVREKISIPLQQTARYIKNYPDDITKEEEKKLKKLFKTDLIEMANSYEPFRSDNVKAKILDYPSSQVLKGYFEAWASMFFKHPVVYFDATIHNTYAYFYSEHHNFIGEDIGFYEITNFKKEIQIHFYDKTEKGRSFLKKIAETINQTPVIGLLYSCYFYIWILIFLTFYLLSLKKYSLFVYFVPLYFTLFTCIISPVNGHMRYLQPIAISIPLAISFVIKEKCIKKKTE